MDYLDFADCLLAVESTSKRLEKTHLVREFLKKTPESEIKPVILMFQGLVFPAYDSRQLGVAEKIVIKALSRALGSTDETIVKIWKRTGDIGIAAEELAKKKSQSTLFSQKLTVKKVFANLEKLASQEGSGSVDAKSALIAELVSSASPLETKYLARAVIGDLRVGIAEGTIRDAIAWAYLSPGENYDSVKKSISPEREHYDSMIQAVQTAYDRCTDFAEVALAAKQGLKQLRSIKLRVGVPIKVMLAQKANSMSDGFARIGTPVELEYKLDGFRLQIHGSSDGIKLFTRRLEDVTFQFPDVVSSVKECIKAKDFLIDAEVVGFDPKTGKFRPFQDISQRIRRKYDIDSLVAKLPVEVNVFDALVVDGKQLLDTPLKERLNIVERIVKPKEKRLVVVSRLVTSSEKEAELFYQKSLKAGNEGIMLKSLDSPYQPGSRVGFMVKLKPVMDTMDLVIVNAEWGEGKRAGWLTSFTVACKSDDGFAEIGKVGTGLKELEAEGLSFGELTELLRPLIINESGREVSLKPEIVLELAFEEVQASPTYSSGFALRFPRIKALRNDRDTTDITSLEEVKLAYSRQRGRHSG